MAGKWTTAGRGILALATSSALGAGCQLSVDFGGARFACDGPSSCPDGLACIDGYCAASAPDHDAGGATDSGDGDGNTVPDQIAWQEYAIGFRDVSFFDELTTGVELTGGPNDLYLGFLSTKPRRTVAEISGMGLQWTLVHEQCSGRNTAGLALFWARGPDAASGKVNVNFAGDSQLGSALLSVHRYSGAADVTPVGNASWANTNGNDDDLSCLGGEDTSTYSWSSLDTSADGSIVVSGAHTSNYASHMPGESYTERGDDQSGDMSLSAGVAVQEQRFADPAIDLEVSGRWEENPDWAVIAVELRD